MVLELLICFFYASENAPFYMNGFCFCFCIYWVEFKIMPSILTLLMGTLKLVPCALNNLAKSEVYKKQLTSSFDERKNIIQNIIH